MKKSNFWVIKRIIIKNLSFLNIFLTTFYKIYLIIFKKVDISFFSEIKITQIMNICFGKRVIIKMGCILDATKKSKIFIGDDVTIQENTYLLNYGGKGIYIGNNTNINKDCILYGHGGLKIGNDCLIAAKCIFITANHNIDNRKIAIRNQGETRRGIKIGNNVWLGVDVKVLDGVSIGDNSVIGAGAVVNKNIPRNSIAIGIPAKVIKKRI